jgi:hypothetical protein
VLLVVLGVAYYWLFVESHPPSDASYALDIDRVRATLDTVPGDKPSAVEVEQVGVFTFPATGVVAGDGWNGVPLPVFSYRLIYPDNSTLIVDTALEQSMGGSELSSFEPGRARARTGRDVHGYADRDHSRAHGSHRRPDCPQQSQGCVAEDRLTREQLLEPERSLPAKFPEHALDGYHRSCTTSISDRAWASC